MGLALLGAVLGAAPALAQAPGAKEPVTVGGGLEAAIVADRMQELGGATNLLIAEGNVEITRGSSRLLADRVEINRDTGEAVAQGRVVFYDGEDRLVSPRIDYNLKTGTGVVYNGSAFSAPYYHVSAERMDRVSDRIYEVRNGVFTTCEGDDPAWSFKVGKGTVELDEFVYGQDASFWVGKVPLLPWVPFFAAALRRERQTGFLFPTLGTSSRKGVFAKVPFYWAISDSQDMTVALDTYSKRGIGLEAEYRYILSRDQAGTLSAFGVTEAFRERREGLGIPENRGWGTVRHAWQVTPTLSFNIDGNATSDDQVYRHYADRISDRSRQFAETNIYATQRWDAWTLTGRVRWYQDLTTTRPIELQRAPEIGLIGVRQAVPGAPWLFYETGASFTNFVRAIGPDGVRADLHPRLYAPIPVAGLFTLTPFVGGRLTYYDRRVVGQHVALVGGQTVVDSVADSRVRRQAEAGVTVEARASRVYALDGGGSLAALQHVIEPRFTVIEIRGLDQKDMPQYDPGARTITGEDPGYDRRTGMDAVGKANEVTYSLTNRLNAKTVAGPAQEPVRWEMLRFVLSQTYKFQPISTPFKDLLGDLIFQPTEHVRVRADARYNVYGLGLREANADVGVLYRDFSFAVGPRFNEQDHQRFLRAEGTARLFRNVDVRAATYWDVINGVAIENRVGIDWRFDCWAILAEFVNRRHGDDEFRISINLLGVGQVGTTARAGF